MSNPTGDQGDLQPEPREGTLSTLDLTCQLTELALRRLYGLLLDRAMQHRLRDHEPMHAQSHSAGLELEDAGWGGGYQPPM